MSYESQIFKVPQESADYAECSVFVTNTVEEIIKNTIASGNNKIFINTNLKLGLPMENINKIAGPFVEAWASETFQLIADDKSNRYENRTTWEFCQLLDRKYLQSSRRTFEQWLSLAVSKGWIKTDD